MLIASAFSLPMLAQKNDKDRIEGSGNVITKDITVKAFDNLTAQGVFSW